MTVPPQPPFSTAPPTPEAEPLGGKKLDTRLAAAEGLLGDLTAQASQDQKFIGQATMDAKARSANIHKRVNDGMDSEVKDGKSIGDRLFKTKDDNEIVALTAVEAESLGLDPVQGQALTKRQLVYELSQQLGQMRRSGANDIFTPSHQGSNGALKQEGERRIARENQYVRIQTALYQDARRLAQSAMFNRAVERATYAAQDLSEAPDWFMKDFVIGVVKADLNDRTQLEAVAHLAAVSALQPSTPDDRERILKAENVTDLAPLEHVWRQAQDAAVKFKDVRQREVEEERIREQAEKVEAKKRNHKERSASLEEDTYRAATEAGRQAAGQIEKYGQDRNSVSVNIGSTEQADIYSIPFSTIFKDERFLRALQANGLSSDQRLRPVAQLRALQIIAEDTDVFESVVQTLAQSSSADRTGYSLADYQAEGREGDWLNNWRTTLRRMIDGYALGVVQGAAEYEIPERAKQQWGVSDRIETDRIEAVTAAFEVLFNEKNILDQSKWGELDPFEVAALVKIGEYRKALKSDPAKAAASSRMEEFLTGEPLRRAVSNAVRTKEGILAAKKQMLEQEEGVTQALAKIYGELDQTLLSLNTFRAGEAMDIHSYIDALSRLQSVQDMKTWLVVDRKDKLNPQLRVNEKTRERIKNDIVRIKEDMSKFQGRDDDRIRRALRNLGSQMESRQAELDFMSRLEQEIRTVNNRIHIDYRGALKGGNRGQFEYWGFPTEGWGKVHEASEPSYQRAYAQICGKEGLIPRIETEYKRLRDSLEKKDIALQERRKVQRELEELQGRAKDAMYQVQRFRENVNLSDGIAFAVKRFLAQDVRSQLQTDGLLHEQGY